MTRVGLFNFGQTAKGGHRRPFAIPATMLVSDAVFGNLKYSFLALEALGVLLKINEGAQCSLLCDIVGVGSLEMASLNRISHDFLKSLGARSD